VMALAIPNANISSVHGRATRMPIRATGHGH
jgi:hypothetical protein